MTKYLAVIKRAPMGIIAQAHHTDTSPESWLGCTGDWSRSVTDAEATLLDDIDHEISLAEGRIRRQYEKIEQETQRLNRLRNFKLGWHVVEE